MEMYRIYKKTLGATPFGMVPPLRSYDLASGEQFLLWQITMIHRENHYFHGHVQWQTVKLLEDYPHQISHRVVDPALSPELLGGR